MHRDDMLVHAPQSGQAAASFPAFFHGAYPTSTPTDLMPRTSTVKPPTPYFSIITPLVALFCQTKKCLVLTKPTFTSFTVTLSHAGHSTVCPSLKPRQNPASRAWRRDPVTIVYDARQDAITVCRAESAWKRSHHSNAHTSIRC